MQGKKIVYLDGRFVREAEAKISALEPGFLHGFGLFETMRSYRHKIIYLDEHLLRIRDSCKLINMRFPYTDAGPKAIIKKTVQLNALPDANVRLTLWKAKAGTAILVTAKEYRPYPPQKYKRGFGAGVSRYRQNEYSFLAGLKSTNRLLYELSFYEAKSRGFDEAFILNSRGYITEGSRSNIFLVKDKEIFTPSPECGCLAGITRSVIFDLAKKYKIKIYEGKFSLQDLCQADEAFLTNSLMGVMPLSYLEAKVIGKAKCKKLTGFFIEKYNSLLK